MADKKISMEDLAQEKADIENLKAHLEDEYRKADISERNYEELRQKYDDRIAEIDKILSDGGLVQAPAKPRAAEKGDDEEEAEEKADEAEEPAAEEPQPEQKEKKGGLFSKLSFGKKKEDDSDPAVAAAKAAEEEAKKGGKKRDETEPDLDGLDPSSPEAIEKLAAQMAGQQGITPSAPAESVSSSDDSGAPKDIEVEKLKVIIDSIRDSQKSTDESVRSLAESIGEMRSMVFQEDSSLKEETSKVERLEDDVAGVKPKEIEAKMRDVAARLEQHEINMEKFQRKSDDLAEKVNKAYEMLKGIGGVENLISINKDVQGKVDDIREALKYTERLALKTERIFIDLNKDIQDIIIYKTRQEGLEDTVKEIVKSMDGVNAKIGDLVTKKDLEAMRGDMIILQKQLDDFNRALPIVDAKMPETIALLRNERNNVLLFMETLREHFKSGVINAVEFEDAKRKNSAKLSKIESDLRAEWQKVQEMMQRGVLPKEGDSQPSGGGDQQAESGQEAAEPPAPTDDQKTSPAEPSSAGSAEHEESDETGGAAKGKKEKPGKQAKKSAGHAEKKHEDHKPASHEKAPHAKKDVRHEKHDKDAKPTKRIVTEAAAPKAEHQPQRANTDFVSQVAQRLDAGKTPEEGKIKLIVDKITSGVSDRTNQPKPGYPIASDMSEVDESSKKEEMGSILKKVKEKMK